MPRQTSESAHYLDIYKLTVEKKRLKQELLALEKRRDRIRERLNSLDQKIHDLEFSAQRLREPNSPSEPHSAEPHSAEPRSTIYPPSQYSDPQDTEHLQTVTLDY